MQCLFRAFRGCSLCLIHIVRLSLSFNLRTLQFFLWEVSQVTSFGQCCCSWDCPIGNSVPQWLVSVFIFTSVSPCCSCHSRPSFLPVPCSTILSFSDFKHFFTSTFLSPCSFLPIAVHIAVSLSQITHFSDWITWRVN